MEKLNEEHYQPLKKALEEILRLCDVHGENSKEKIKAICLKILEDKQ